MQWPRSCPTSRLFSPARAGDRGGGHQPPPHCEHSQESVTRVKPKCAACEAITVAVGTNGAERWAAYPRADEGPVFRSGGHRGRGSAGAGRRGRSRRIRGLCAGAMVDATEGVRPGLSSRRLSGDARSRCRPCPAEMGDVLSGEPRTRPAYGHGTCTPLGRFERSARGGLRCRGDHRAPDGRSCSAGGRDARAFGLRDRRRHRGRDQRQGCRTNLCRPRPTAASLGCRREAGGVGCGRDWRQRRHKPRRGARSRPRRNRDTRTRGASERRARSARVSMRA